MAFIATDSEDATNPTFYNVNEAVGFGCKNLEEDVKIVQFFLKRAYMVPGAKEIKPYGEMVIDGKCGPITRRWITKFQMDSCRFGTKLITDGIVSKAGSEKNPDNYELLDSHALYTIRRLNGIVQKHEPALYKTLPTNPEVPVDVRIIFMQMHAEGPPMIYSKN